MSATTVNPTLADRLWPATAGPGVLRAVLLALFGSLLLWASAKIQVPFYPVPITMQTAVVFLLGIAYGPRLAIATILLYIAQGALGLPANTGWVAQRSRHWLAIGLGVLAAIVVNYTFGVAWLTTFVGWPKAFTVGVLPFLLGDLLKLALVTALAEAGISRLRQHLAD